MNSNRGDDALKEGKVDRTVGSGRRAWFAVALLAMSPLLPAQVSKKTPARGPVALAEQVLPDDDLGVAGAPDLASVTTSDWIVLPWLGAAFQYFDNGVSDPSVRVKIAPGFSGDPVLWEDFRFQWPRNPGRVGDIALVIAFHGYSQSDNSVFVLTDLAQQCQNRGWMLLTPLGLHQKNYGNPNSQATLNIVLSMVQMFFEFNEDRIYGVGFSMGGCNALSYAMRHQDPAGLRMAGVVAHTAVLDLVDTFLTGDTGVQAAMQDPTVFGGTPGQEPFAYGRTSPMIVSGGLPDPAFSSVSNILHLPIYYHVNTLDAGNQELLDQNDVLKTFLLANSANVQVSEVTIPNPKHDWSTMNMTAALDFLSPYSLPADPSSLDVYADREVPYFYTHPRDIAADEVARYDVDVDTGTNTFTLQDTHDLNQVAFDTVAMGLDPTQPLNINHSSGDLTQDEIVLTGYLTSPSSVTVSSFPPFSWSYDSGNQEVIINPTPGGAPASVLVGQPAPLADFTPSVLAGQLPLEVDFTDATWGEVTTYSWDFGDGVGTSSAPNPTYIYNDPGTYTVSLSTTGPGGADVESKTDLIVVTAPAPTPDFSADVFSGAAPLEVNFTDLTTGFVESWSWDFGDSVGTSTDQDPTYTYLSPGTFSVTLTATGPGGSNPITKTDYITVTSTPPTANFMADSTGGSAPFTVNFTDLSTGTVTDYDWDFGDLNTSMAANPQHTYTSAGTYTVELTVTGPSGNDTETKVNYITVFPF